MADLMRKDDEIPELNDRELPTADLAERDERSLDPAQRVRPQSVPAAEGSGRTIDSELRRENPVPSARAGTVALTRDAAQYDSPAVPADGGATPLFSQSEISDYRSRWTDIQASFVDEPRHAVGDADNLVDSLMKQLADGFARERSRLESHWDRGDSVSTEDLRLALQRYRSFFDRLLKV